MKQEVISAEEYKRRMGIRGPRTVKAKRLRNAGPMPQVQGGEGWVEFLIPVRVTTGINAERREYRMDRARRVKLEHEATVQALTITREGRAALARLSPPYRITLTAITPRVGDDDGRVGGLKGVRDAIAAVLGIDDGDESAVTWVYAKPERGKWAARARIEIKET